MCFPLILFFIAINEEGFFLKKFLILAAVVVVFSSSAFAEVQDFGIFKADIPAGWTAEQDRTTVGVMRDDKTASMSVTVEENDGTSLKDLADAFMSELNGRNLTTDEHGNAVFEFTASAGTNSRVVLNADEKHFALIVITLAEGSPDTAPNEISAMLDSLVFRDI